MRPQAGVGKLKHALPMQANDLPVVAQAVSPAYRILSQLLTVVARIRVGLGSEPGPEGTPSASDALLASTLAIMALV